VLLKFILLQPRSKKKRSDVARDGKIMVKVVAKLSCRSQKKHMLIHGLQELMRMLLLKPQNGLNSKNSRKRYS